MPERGPHPCQHAAPYLEALQSFAARDPRRAMVPGHKGGGAADGGLRAALSDGALALDLPTLIEGVDVAAGGEVAPYEVARRLAADAWGARRTWFLTNGASQGNLAASASHIARTLQFTSKDCGRSFSWTPHARANAP